MSLRRQKTVLQQKDKQYLWHPFTQMKEWMEEDIVVITEARGAFLKDITGRWYIDGVSSLWVNVHGHRKREIDDAIKGQIDKVSHSTLLGLTHPPAIGLAERLIKIINSSLSSRHSSLSRVFYSDNGSTAVEIALKMAFQYWQHKGMKGKKRFLSLKNAYHGDTIGAVSVGGIDVFHKAFSHLLFRTYKAPSPYCYRCEFDLQYPHCRLHCLGRLEDILKRHFEDIAALIIEPIVQAAGGMIISPPGYLSGVRRLCNKYNILMIADEVATGFGRTGRMFACEHEGVVPDILCLAKGITGGYLPLAVTITTEEVYEAFLGRYEDLKTFFHGHTYTGNQLACMAAIANLDIFKKERTLKKMQKKIEFLRKRLEEIKELPIVGDVRQKGFMIGIEIVKDKETRETFPLKEKMGWRVCYKAREKGLLIRPLGNVVVLMPPLSISTEELERMLSIVTESIKLVN
ncbi:MAG: adenosylmethionine--8-amino-7-oxononanoate transaminase [Thermodesulfovibrionia bacterium]